MGSRKLKIQRPISWPHHNGGWRWVVEQLQALHDPSGTRCLTAVEDELYYHGAVLEPWVGFIHQVPHQTANFPDLTRLVKMPAWRESLPHCRGLWVLSEYLRGTLRQLGVTVPIALVRYPTPTPATKWSAETMRAGPRDVHFIGEFLRNYQAFYDLDAGDREKVFLAYPDYDAHQLGLRSNGSVRVLPRIEPAAYEDVLCRSVVFLNLYDAGANTTVVECLVRGTPIVINRLAGVEEYLGADYPLFYDSLEEAAVLLADEHRLLAGSRYLLELPLRVELEGERFLENLQATAIYRELPSPPRELRRFRPRDATVLMCSYRRTSTLPEVLERFAKQDLDGSFELVLWNNCREAAEEVDATARTFEDDIDLRVIHSSANLLCGVRLAMPAIMRSDVLVVCDDDVLVAPDYLTRFLGAHHEHPEQVLCYRGHEFLAHQLDEDRPELVWERGEHLRFHDHATSERFVHFMHADNCVFSRDTVARLAQYPMRPLETVLVDDYWMSFVLWHHLDTPIRKLYGPDAFTFLPSAEDPNIALFHDRRVAEERIRFYVTHMRQGWPSWTERIAQRA